MVEILGEVFPFQRALIISNAERERREEETRFTSNGKNTQFEKNDGWMNRWTSRKDKKEKLDFPKLLNFFLLPFFSISR